MTQPFKNPATLEATNGALVSVERNSVTHYDLATADDAKRFRTIAEGRKSFGVGVDIKNGVIVREPEAHAGDSMLTAVSDSQAIQSIESIASQLGSVIAAGKANAAILEREEAAAKPEIAIPEFTKTLRKRTPVQKAA